MKERHFQEVAEVDMANAVDVGLPVHSIHGTVRLLRHKIYLTFEQLSHVYFISHTTKMAIDSILHHLFDVKAAIASYDEL